MSLASFEIKEILKDIFIGGVFTDELQDRDNGGPECVRYMTLKFRLLVSVVMVR